VTLSRSDTGAIEVYGESEARPVFSAEFNVPPQRATVLALSELRLPPDTEALKLEEVLPRPERNPINNDLSRNALPYATALAGACPRLAPAANLLAPDKRRLSSRRALIPTVVLGIVVLAAIITPIVYSRYAERQYLKKLDAEIARLEPQAQRASTLDRQIAQARQRAVLLDKFRRQTHEDLDSLQELTKLVEPPAWINFIDLTRDAVRIGGEAPQASVLVRILDASPLFEDSKPDMIQRAAQGETFQIHMTREARK